MRCEHCGREIADDSYSCKYCGGIFGSQLTVELPIKLDHEMNITPEVQSVPKTKKNQQGKITLLVIVISIAAIIFSVIAIINNNQNRASETPETNSETAADDDVYIESVRASSELKENQIIHSAESVCDNDTSTAWVEGAQGNGIGESITIQFDKDYFVKEIAINAGYQKSSDLYLKNNRPSQITVSFSDGTSESHYLDDVNGIQYVRLDESVVTDKVVLTIDAVYQGTAYTDTCISEIGFNP